jgi:peptidoglycan hydrolase-like protein with peptidoglycan-binding domain
MRTARNLASAVAAVGIAVAGVGVVVTTQAAADPIVGAPGYSVLATVNFGLSTQQAKNVQCFLRTSPASYTGAIDGQLGTNSWKAMQRWLREYWDYNDSIDGDPGPNTVRALQRMLAFGWDYNDSIDGDPGPNTRAAFKRFANDMSVFFPC